MPYGGKVRWGKVWWNDSIWQKKVCRSVVWGIMENLPNLPNVSPAKLSRYMVAT